MKFAHIARKARRSCLLLASTGFWIIPGSANATGIACGAVSQNYLGSDSKLEITSAEVIGPSSKRVSMAGESVGFADDASISTSDLPRFCRVTAVASPVAGSHIGIELWLPEKWNGKLLGLGNHGFGGEYERGYMALGLQRGYAVVTTDTGHSSRNNDRQAGFTAGRAAFSGFNIGTASFVTNNPIAVDDFAWRAVHEMTLAAKAIVTKYYGMPARRAYFDGCSTGGRQGMREAQQFPSDFDGIIAGSAPMHWTRVIGSGLEYYLAGYLPGGQRISKQKLAVAQRGAIGACDANDGLVDGLIADPARCNFDPARLVCRPGQNESECLTPAEAIAVAKVENPFISPRNGELLYPPLPPGGESHWRLMTDLNPVTAAHFRYLVMNDATWTPNANTNLWAAIERSEKSGAPGLKINTVSRDLSAFRKHGGKLIQYHGWADEAMSANFNPRYYGEVVDLQPGTAKLSQTQSFYRLFMVPGMTHCNGGDGPVNFGGLNHVPSPVRDADHDVLEALDRWVEKGAAPDRIIASEIAMDGKVKRQMPLCPWPQVAIYTRGDPASYLSFACRMPASAAFKRTSKASRTLG